MVKVEAGTFMMGATPEMKNPIFKEEPVHQVTLTKDYYIGKYEVTQALWKAVMGNNPSFNEGGNLPVERMSYTECLMFISKLNDMTGMIFRLPTEAEWEFAARGGRKSRGYQYSGGNKLSDVAWYDANSNYKTHPVGTKLANELGIYDMSGNVAEFCHDRYETYSETPQIDPIGKGKSLVRRGGSWREGTWFCRSSCREDQLPGDYGYTTGFRLVLSE